MAIILTSFLKTHYYGEDGNRIAIPLEDENGILQNIKRYLPRAENLLLVANDPFDFEDNDAKINVVAQSFEKTGIAFKRTTVLDERNKGKAAEIIGAADLMILSGGKCWCQKKFFDEIGLKALLTNHEGVVIGVSAGSMNLCNTIANFPEEASDLNDPRWFDGMGFFDGIIIPHFDGETATYQFDCGEINVARDYVRPMSHEKDFIGLPNGSFIVIDNGGEISYHGDVYKISKGVVIKCK